MTSAMCGAEIVIADYKWKTECEPLPGVSCQEGGACTGEEYRKGKAGDDCDKLIPKSGCIEGHQCGGAELLGIPIPGVQTCVPEASCGTYDRVCTASALAASMITVLGIMTQI